MKRNTPSIALLLFLLVAVTGCSTKKNTWSSRQYHSITTRFNVLFNANASFNEAVKKAESLYPQSFDELLPVFAATYPEAPNITMSDLDRAITKSNKAIAKHSITAKPKRKAAPTEAYRKFYNKREFNNMIDDAYLVIGKAQVYSQDYDAAKLTLQNIITNYPGQNSIVDARILLATISAQTDSPEDAEEQLKNLELRLQRDKEIIYSKQLRRIINSTWASVYIKQKRYNEAITKLEEALNETRHRGTKLRYRFILAQLHERTGNNGMATAYYERIAKMNVPYEVQFSALMNIANTMNSATQGKELERRYKKMLGNKNNTEYFDQIYYALGNLAKTQGDTTVAIRYYEKSVDASIDNNIQKGLSSLMLGTYYYSVQDYYPSYNGYSSAAELLVNHPRQKYADSMANKLSIVGRNLNVVNREDSLQRIAKMEPSQRQTFADGLAREALQREQIANQQYQYSGGYNYQYNTQATPGMKAQSAPTAGRWYFYNTIAVNQGTNEFKSRWGHRKLEDNWRRKNKAVSTISDADNVDDLLADDELMDDFASKMELPVTSAEYYLQDVPLTEETMVASNARLERALYNLAAAYRSDLNNNQKSLEIFNRLLDEFPENEHRSSIYFTSYQLLTEEARYAEAEQYKTRLINEFPESKMALSLQNPNYLQEMTKLEEQAERRYDDALALYRSGNNDQAHSIINSSLQNYKGLAVEPNFALLKILTTAYDSNVDSYKEDLQGVVKTYPNTSAYVAAKNILATLEKDGLQPLTPGIEIPSPPTSEEEKPKLPVIIEESVTADQDYSYTEDEEHVVVVVVNKDMVVNQLAFNIALFNADHYLNQNYQLAQESNFDSNNQAIVVSTFTSAAEAMVYYNVIVNESFVLSSENSLCFAISKNNFERLKLKKSIANYLPFFQENYLQGLGKALKEQTKEVKAEPTTVQE